MSIIPLPESASTATKYKPLSELTLLLPNTWSFKAFTSHGRDVGFHSYTNEPPLFTVEAPNSSPEPTTLLLKTPEKLTIAKCVPTHKPGTRPSDQWEIIVPRQISPNARRDSMETLVEAEVKSVMEKLGKDVYQLSVPTLQAAFRWQRQEYATPAVTTFSKPDWKLINPSTGEVHAVFLERWAATERGQIQFRRSFGREWELSLVVSVGLIVEEGRKRKMRRGNFAIGMARGQGATMFVEEPRIIPRIIVHQQQN